MRLKYIGLLYFSVCFYNAEAQVYAVSAIPDSLKENAVAVKRIETIFTGQKFKESNCKTQVCYYHS